MPAILLRSLLALLLLVPGLIAPPAEGGVAQDAAEPSSSPIAPGVEIPGTLAGERLEQVFEWLRTGVLDEPEAMFSPRFLEAVPTPRLQALRGQLFGRGDLRLTGIQLNPAPGVDLIAALEHTRAGADPTYWRMPLGLDDDGLLETLLIQPGIPPALKAVTTFEEIDEALNALPGRVVGAAYELVGDPTAGEPLELRPVWEREPDAVLALGSTFKLWVLGAVGESVAAGELTWDQPIPIVEAHKSLPSGEMQVFPEGQTFPLSHFATEMIRVSDNTATDHLIRLVGRERVEDFARRTGKDDPRNFPFLTTREMFQVKLGGDAERRDRFAEASEADRRAMLAPGGAIQVLNPSIMLAVAWQKPVLIEEVEWFASPRQTARIMAALRVMEASAKGEAGGVGTGAGPELGEAMRQNPGLGFDVSDWTTIGYKGGSEPGVLNMSWQLQRADGRWFCLTFGWNDADEPVDMQQLVPIIQAASKVLAETP